MAPGGTDTGRRGRLTDQGAFSQPGNPRQPVFALRIPGRRYDQRGSFQVTREVDKVSHTNLVQVQVCRSGESVDWRR
jgi:hypothetical protein